VLAFVGGTLPPETLPAVEDHLATCTACAELVTWAAADQDSAIRLPGPDGRPFVGRLQPGARIDRYQILGAIGRGAMGEVYAAYHPDLDRRIAVKVVYGSEETADDRRRERLLLDALARRLESQFRANPQPSSEHDAFGARHGRIAACRDEDGWAIGISQVGCIGHTRVHTGGP